MAVRSLHAEAVGDHPAANASPSSACRSSSYHDCFRPAAGQWTPRSRLRPMRSIGTNRCASETNRQACRRVHNGGLAARLPFYGDRAVRSRRYSPFPRRNPIPARRWRALIMMPIRKSLRFAAGTCRKIRIATHPGSTNQILRMRLDISSGDDICAARPRFRERPRLSSVRDCCVFFPNFASGWELR